MLLAWGAADPVFDDDFAADLDERLPLAELHRFPRANHLVMAEADVAAIVGTWLDTTVALAAWGPHSGRHNYGELPPAIRPGTAPMQCRS